MEPRKRPNSIGKPLIHWPIKYATDLDKLIEHAQNIKSECHKCVMSGVKVSPGGTFSFGNFIFDERENYQV